MPATLDTTIGGESSNGYCTIAQADAYHDELLSSVSDVWAALSDDDKTRMLITATRLLDEHVEWVATPTTFTQRLAWPRAGITTRQGNIVALDELPDALVQATAEFARQLSVTDRAADPALANVGLKALKAGPIELEFSGTQEAKVVPDAVWSLISLWAIQVDERTDGVSKVMRT
jgi:hypothetical protein